MHLIVLHYLSPSPLGIILGGEGGDIHKMTSERRGKQDLTLAAASSSVPNLWILVYGSKKLTVLPFILLRCITYADTCFILLPLPEL